MIKPMPNLSEYINALEMYQASHNATLMANRRPFDKDTVKKVWTNPDVVTQFENEVRASDINQFRTLESIPIKYPVDTQTLNQLSAACLTAGNNVRTALTQHFNAKHPSVPLNDAELKYIREAERNYLFSLMSSLKVDEQAIFLINNHILNIYDSDRIPAAFEETVKRKLETAVTLGDQGKPAFVANKIEKYRIMVGTDKAASILAGELTRLVNEYNLSHPNQRIDLDIKSEVAIALSQSAPVQTKEEIKEPKKEIKESKRESQEESKKSKGSHTTIFSTLKQKLRTSRDKSPPKSSENATRQTDQMLRQTQYYLCNITNQTASALTDAPLDSKAHLSYKGERTVVEEISLQNHSKKRTKLDYLAFDPATGTGICEAWGKRDTQEDRVNMGQLPGFEKLNDDGKKSALVNLVAGLNQTAASQEPEKTKKQGTTLCATVIVGNEIHNINIGDSRSFVVVWDENGKVVQCDRLNELHNPKNMTSKQINQLKEYGVETSAGLLGIVREDGSFGSLALARTIGKTEFEGAYKAHPEVFHHPEYTHTTVDIPPRGRAVVMNGCDGMEAQWENQNLSEQQRKAKLEEFLTGKQMLTTMELSEAMVRHAFKNGSTDNISVVCTEIDPNNKTPRYISIEDGMDGDAISHAVSMNFDTQIQLAVTNEIVNQFSPKEYTLEELRTNANITLPRNTTLYIPKESEATAKVRVEPEVTNTSNQEPALTGRERSSKQKLEPYRPPQAETSTSSTPESSKSSPTGRPRR